MTATKKTFTDRLYLLSLSLKGIDGTVELIGGSLLLFIHPNSIHDFIFSLTNNELTQDPGDFLANHLRVFAQSLSLSKQYFASIYLLIHGAVKVGLVVALLKAKPWAYPWGLAIIGLFTVYQIYQLAVTPSLGLVLVTVLDIIVLILIWLEYQKVRHKLAVPKLG